MSRIKVLVADDHPVFLEGLTTVLELKDPSIELVGTASNGREAVELQARKKADVVLLDIKMPEMGGVEAAIAIRRHHPNTKLIMLTTFDDRELVDSALQAGAHGYLLKDTPVSEIVKAIKAAHRGRMLMSPRVAEKLTHIDEDRGESGFAIRQLAELTAREREILTLMAKGNDNNAIAEELFISEKTVRNHVSHIYHIIGVHNRTQAVIWAFDQGLT